MKGPIILFPLLASPYLTMVMTLLLVITAANYWTVKNQNIELMVKQGETLEILKDAQETLENEEENKKKLENCKLQVKREKADCDIKIGAIQTEMKQKDERTLELGKLLNDARKQFNHAKDETFDEVFKPLAKTNITNTELMH